MSTNQFKGAKTMPIGIEKSQLTRFLGYHSNIILSVKHPSVWLTVYNKKRKHNNKKTRS